MFGFDWPWCSSLIGLWICLGKLQWSTMEMIQESRRESMWLTEQCIEVSKPWIYHQLIIHGLCCWGWGKVCYVPTL